MKKIFVQLLILIIASVAILSNSNAATPAYKLFDLKQKENVSFKQYIKNYALLTLNKTVLHEIYLNRSGNIDIQIPLNATQTITVNLKKSRVLSDGFIISTPEGNVNYTPGVYYQGKIDGINPSRGSMSFFENSMMGVVSNEKGNYVIGTIDSKNPSSVDYIIYNDADMLVQNPFECHVDEDHVLPGSYKNGGPEVPDFSGACKLIELYLECDNKLYSDKGNSVSNVVNYVTGFMNEVALIYSNENISIAIKQIYIWTTPDPYPTTSSSAALTAFQSHLNGTFNGDIAHLLSTTTSNLGGVSYVDVLCNQTYGVSYSNIYNTYSAFPTYSWTVEVVAHEMGHSFGSQHTHWCGWQLTSSVTGPIDTCYTPEGGCYTGPNHPKMGTIMSYCHLNSSINFNLGFGPLPGNLIRSRYNAVTCALNPVVGSVAVSGTNALCAGKTANFNSSACSGSSFTWTGPAGFTSTAQNPSIINVQTSNAGTYNVTATYTGCTSDPVSTSLNISAQPAANVTVLGSPNICTGGSVTLSAGTGSGYTYQWKKSGNAIAGATSSTYVVTDGGTYKVVVNNAGGCSKTSAGIVITGPPSSSVSASGSLTFCAGGSVTLTAASGYNYQWRLNNNNISGATQQNYMATAAGTYTCVVTNSFGCSKISGSKKVKINCRLLGSSTSDVPFTVSPNPFADNFSLKFATAGDESADVKIFDMLGKQIAWYKSVITKDGITTGEDLQPGIYMIRVAIGDKQQNIKVIKK